MSRAKHILGHGLLIALQFAAQFGPVVPGKYKPLALGIGTVAQAVLALVNHTPD